MIRLLMSPDVQSGQTPQLMDMINNNITGMKIKI